MREKEKNNEEIVYAWSVWKKRIVEFVKDYKALLCTYLIMMIIPLIVFVGSCYYIRKSWEREAYQYQEAILSQAASISDNVLKQAQLAVHTVIIDADTRELLQEEEWDGKMMFSVVSLVDKLFCMKNSYDCIDSLGVYFHKSNSFVTERKRYSTPLHSVYLEPYGITEEKFVELTKDYQGYFLVSEETGTWLVLYQNAYNYSNKIRIATAYAIISCDALEAELQYLDTLDGSCIFIMGSQGELIGNTNSSIPIENLPDLEVLSAQAGTGESIMKSQRGDILLFGVPSGKWNMYYGMYMSRSSFYHKIYKFTYYCVAAFFLSIILGIVLAVYLTKETSEPVRYLLSLIDTNQQKHAGVFMVQSCKMLEQKLLQLKQDYHTLAFQAEAYNTKNLELILQGFMKGIYPNEDWILDIYDEEPRLQKIAEYRVVLFCFNGIENCSFIKNQHESLESYSLLFFSIKNVIDEAFLGINRDDTGGISLIIDDMAACIVSAEDSGQDADEELILKAKTCIDFIQKIFELESYVVVSNRHSLWSELPAAYDEATMTAAQIAFWEKKEPVNFYLMEFGTIESRDGSELLELKKKFSSCLIVNHYEEAQQILDEIVSNCFSQNIQYLSYNQCQAYALISMVLDKLEDIDIQNQMKADYSARLLHTHSIRELRDEMQSVFQDILEYRRQNTSEPEWTEKVKSYIQDNYQDSNLSIAYIADYFSMSPSHMGNRFRKSMGIGILDYIHIVRLKECKELLAQGKTIKYCAETTGYADIKTMQRAFKRYEGVTPGQYKEEFFQKNATK